MNNILTALFICIYTSTIVHAMDPPNRALKEPKEIAKPQTGTGRVPYLSEMPPKHTHKHQELYAPLVPEELAHKFDRKCPKYNPRKDATTEKPCVREKPKFKEKPWPLRKEAIDTRLDIERAYYYSSNVNIELEHLVKMEELIFSEITKLYGINSDSIELVSAINNQDLEKAKTWFTDRDGTMSASDSAVRLVCGMEDELSEVFMQMREKMDSVRKMTSHRKKLNTHLDIITQCYAIYLGFEYAVLSNQGIQARRAKKEAGELDVIVSEILQILRNHAAWDVEKLMSTQRSQKYKDVINDFNEKVKSPLEFRNYEHFLECATNYKRFSNMIDEINIEESIHADHCEQALLWRILRKITNQEIRILVAIEVARRTGRKYPLSKPELGPDTEKALNEVIETLWTELRWDVRRFDLGVMIPPQLEQDKQIDKTSLNFESWMTMSVQEKKSPFPRPDQLAKVPAMVVNSHLIDIECARMLGFDARNTLPERLAQDLVSGVYEVQTGPESVECLHSVLESDAVNLKGLEWRNCMLRFNKGPHKGIHVFLDGSPQIMEEDDYDEESDDP